MGPGLRIAAIATWLATIAGCYASHERDEGCPRPVGLVSPITDRGDMHGCTVAGVDSVGTRWSMFCDGAVCTLSRDGEAVCDCETLDWANTCATGLATCAEWRYFDYAHIGPGP